MAFDTYDASKYGALHDVASDPGSRRLATASEDCVVRIWDVGTKQVMNELRGHKAVVVSLAWAGGRFAATLASGATDGQVVLWREVRAGDWQFVHQLNVTGSVSVVAFCPPDYGLVLAVAGADSLGVVTMLLWTEVAASPVQPTGEHWQVRAFPAHEGGVASLGWAPSTSPATLATGPAVSRAAGRPPARLATCGAGGGLCVWQSDGGMDAWTLQHELRNEQVIGPLRDLAWRPNVGLPSSLLAAGSAGGAVALWAQDMEGQPWRLRACWRVDGDARRLAWSRSGTLLSVSVGDEGTVFFKEGVFGQWDSICEYAC